MLFERFTLDTQICVVVGQVIMYLHSTQSVLLMFKYLFSNHIYYRFIK